MSDAQSTNGHEWVLSRIRARTESTPDGEQNGSSNVWTGIRHLKQDASESDRYDRDDVRQIVTELIEAGDVLSWHGLLAPLDDDHLTAIIESERQSDAPRKLLIKRINRLRAGESA